MTQPAPEIPNLVGLQQDLRQFAGPGRTLTLLAEQSSQVAAQRSPTTALPGLLLSLDGIADMTHDLTRRRTHELPVTHPAAPRRRERRSDPDHVVAAGATTSAAVVRGNVARLDGADTTDTAPINGARPDAAVSSAEQARQLKASLQADARFQDIEAV